MSKADNVAWCWKGGFGGDGDWRERGLSEEHEYIEESSKTGKALSRSKFAGPDPWMGVIGLKI
jgi:hypothetical protein